MHSKHLCVYCTNLSQTIENIWGTGVILERYEEIRDAIKDTVMTTFFDTDYLNWYSSSRFFFFFRVLLMFCFWNSCLFFILFFFCCCWILRYFKDKLIKLNFVDLTEQLVYKHNACEIFLEAVLEDPKLVNVVFFSPNHLFHFWFRFPIVELIFFWLSHVFFKLLTAFDHT